MHRPARAVIAVVALATVLVTGLGATMSPALAAVQRAVPVTTIATVTPSPFLSASDTLTVTGTTSATNDTVTVGLTPVTLTAVSKSATVNADKSWTVTFTRAQLNGVSDGTVTVTATSSNTINGTGTAVTRTFTKDTVVPSISSSAVTPTLMGATQAGVVATVSGTVVASTTLGAAGESGDTVTITADDTDTSTNPVTVTTTTGTSGAFSTTINTATLVDGTITYTYVAKDPAGNPSTAATKTNTKDATPPNAPTVQVSPTTIANATKNAVTVSGAATGGAATVTISIADGVHTPVTTSATVSSNAYSKSAIDVSSLNDGSLTVSVTAVDAAGNASAATSTTVGKDTVAPTSTLVAPAYITAATTDATPLSGVSEAGAVIALKAVTTGTTSPSITGTLTVPAGGQWSTTLSTSSLPEGSITFTATPTDAAGNTGAAATATSTKDLTPPAAPATVTATPSPWTTGTFTVAGTTATADRAAALTVDITITDGSGQTITALNQPVTPASGAQTAGTFSVAFTATQLGGLAEGGLDITAVLRDAAGNGSAATTAYAEKGVLRLVSTNPVDGSTLKPPATISATYNQVLSASGTGTTSTIVVKNAAGATIAGSTTITGKTITFTPTTELPDATYFVNVTAYDKAYTNQSVTSGFSFASQVNAPPGAPAIEFATNPVNATNQTAVVVRGIADIAGKPVTVTAGSISKTVTAGTDRTWSVTLDLTSLPDGSVGIEATQSDGVHTSAPSSRTITKDTAAPVKLSTVPTADAVVQTLSSVKFSFDESLASTGTITVPGVAGTSSVAARTITFTSTSPFPNGPYTATARVTDSAGNPTTATVSFYVGTPPPTASAISLDALPASVVYGASITLRGTVTQTTKAAYGNVVLRAVTSTGQVVTIGTIKPGSTGKYAKTFKPMVNATYQVGYAGDTRNTSSVSVQRETDVAAKVTVTSARGKASADAVVTGIVTPSNGSTVVTLYKMVDGNRVKIGTDTVDGNHRYRFEVKLPKGRTPLLVTVAATANNAGGSATVTAVRT